MSSGQHDNQEILRLTREGVWLANGEEISHVPTRQLFARSLVRLPDQSYELQIGRESKSVEVEDTAYFVENLRGTAHQGFEVYLSHQRWEKLDPKTLRYEPSRLTCCIENGAEAKFLRRPYLEILKGLDDDGGEYSITIAGIKHRLMFSK